MFAAFIPNPEDMQPLLAIVAGWFGPLDGAEAALAPVRALSPVADLAGPLPYVVLQSLVDEIVPHGMAALLEVGLLHRAARTSHRQHRGGQRPQADADLAAAVLPPARAVTRVGVADTAFPHRSPSWDFDALAQWSEPEQAEAGIGWARGIWDEIAPKSSGVYVNHLDADDKGRVGQAYGPNYERLSA